MTGAVFLAALFSGALQPGGASSTGSALLEQYIDERVSFRFGGAFHCDPSGAEQVLAAVAKRLSAIRVAMVERFGEAAVASADAQVEPRFAEAWGEVSPGGCRRNDPVFDRGNLRALWKKHDGALDALEGALRSARKVEQ